MVAVRKRPNSSRIARGVVPFWAYYDQDRAIHLSQSQSSLMFLSRACNVSFSGAFSSNRPLHSFESGNQIVNLFFVEGTGPKSATVLRSGKLAMMVAAPCLDAQVERTSKRPAQQGP